MRNEKPIIFGSEMVKAVLSGYKTQTRRVIKRPEQWMIEFDGEAHRASDQYGDSYDILEVCPYGKIGAQLWVREKWRIGAWNENGEIAIDYANGDCLPYVEVPDPDAHEKLWIQCTDECIKKGVEENEEGHYSWDKGSSPLKWRPSIFMPRWASRIQLEITDIRVERVQDITDSNATAEGIVTAPTSIVTPRMSFKKLWDSINAKRGYSWDKNPWCWCLTFKVIK